MKLFIFIITCSIFFLTACQNQNQTYTLQITNTYNFPVQNLEQHILLYWEKGIDFDGLWLKKSDTVFAKYNFQSRHYTDSITFNKYFIYEFRYCAIVDSGIYLFDKERQSIVYCNKQGLVKSRFKFNDSTAEIYPWLTKFEINLDSKVILAYGRKLRLPRDNKEYFSGFTLVEVVLKDSTISPVNYYGKFPVEYIDAMFSENYPTACTTPNGLTTVFSTQPTFFVDSQGSQFKREIIGLKKNRYFKVDVDSVMHSAYNRRINVEEESYVKMLYDSATETYALFQVNPLINSENSNFEVPIYTDKPFTIYLIKNYKVIAIREFPAISDYAFRFSYFNQGRLWIPRIKEETNNLKIETYELHEE